MPHQYELLEKCKEKKNKFIFITGANRRGKTELLTTDAALYAEARHPFVKTPKRATYWLSVTDFKKWDEVLFPKFREKLKPGCYTVNRQAGVITITSGPGKGNKIVLKSQEQGVLSYEGAKVHRASTDEEHDQRIFNALVVRTIDTGGQVLIAATLINGLTYLYDDFIEPFLSGKRDDVFISTGGMQDNVTLDRNEIAKARRQIELEDPLLAKIRFGGEFVSLGGSQVFSASAITEFIKESKEPLRVHI
jgi:hypothetical protein